MKVNKEPEKDELYYEILDIMINWICTNKVQYEKYEFLGLGYFTNYEPDYKNIIPDNYFKLVFEMFLFLFSNDFVKYLDKYEQDQHKRQDYYFMLLVAIFEDEKLCDIHEKILKWCEMHRLHSDFNRPRKGKKKCYRPRQYSHAKMWLRKKLRRDLMLWNWINQIPSRLSYNM